MLETCGGSGTHNKTIVLRGTVKPKQTNADRIRAMNDEELAKWIYDVSITDGFCPCLYGNTREPCITHNFECVPCLIDWLKQEVET